MLEMRFRPCPCKGGLLSNLRHFRLLAYLGSWLYNATRMYIYIYIQIIQLHSCWGQLPESRNMLKHTVAWRLHGGEPARC